ncbi:unnamed protein product [Clavelina lepadiformis]|uniref:Essential protein Yae1 N-terminal domain-containing protein n=1 Tax=Clavelina lepadiformis TaxID=159417 RepID=A0ABP0G449_CLALP
MDDDEIFDEDCSELSIMTRDWEKIRKERLKDGYVNGVTAGQEASLQNGFDTGFKQGLLSSFLLSKIKGILNGLMAFRAFYEGNPIPDDVILEAQNLLEDIASLEADSVADDFFKMTINGNKESSDTTEEMIDSLGDLSSMDIDNAKHSCSSEDVNVTSESHSCKCGEPNESCVGTVKSQSSNNSCEDLSLGNSSSDQRIHTDVMDWNDAKLILLNCPDIADIVNRCKQILKRLHWTDKTIDKLF